jgi:hypothetical protein
LGSHCAVTVESAIRTDIIKVIETIASISVKAASDLAITVKRFIIRVSAAAAPC